MRSAVSWRSMGVRAAAEAKVLIEGRLGDGEWQRIAELGPGEDGFAAPLEALAGGWFRLEVRAVADGQVVASAEVGHVGVGEVFVIAGQSNSANHGGEKQRVGSGKVASFDGERWRIADDPQPGASGGGGSFIPPFGDAIAERLGVPVGIVATGVGATSVREWLPAGESFPNPPTIETRVKRLPDGRWESLGGAFANLIKRAGSLGLGGFRAVLWHQGESDANQRDPTRTLAGDLYQRYLAEVIAASRRELGWEVPWFVAQASYHTPDDPGSAQIRAAQAALWQGGIALEGPDTDALTGDLRDRDGQGVHFSGAGLRAHGLAWGEKVAPWIEAMGEVDGAVIKVFILAGQSNMEGQGVVSMDGERDYNGGRGNLVWSMSHSPSKGQMGHLRTADGEWVERDDVEISFHSRAGLRHGGLTVGYTGYGGSSHIGPELQFGHVVGDHFREPVLLIKTAWGGKSLQVDFRPPGSSGETGAYYKQMIAEVRAALAALGERRFELCGFVWMQGWNDMVSAEAVAEYEENLVNFANDVRAEFSLPDLAFVIGELGNGGAAKPGGNMHHFRAAQRRASEQLDRATFVPTQGFARPKEQSPNIGHGHHWFGNAESYFLIGGALGEAMIDLQVDGK
ncbi:MAG: sialate O-acetylesterase [Verrucomicrobiales bacterium]